MEVVITRDNPILQGLARALWVSAYADEIEETERKWSAEPPRASGGGDWNDVAPETPERAFELAFYVVGSFEAANKLNIHSIVARAFKADGIESSDEALEEFGHYLGMSVLGSGVCWEDRHADSDIKYPNHDCGELQGELWEDIERYLEQEHGIVDLSQAGDEEAS